MTPRVPVNPELLRWALRRCGRTADDLSHRFKKLDDWLEGRIHPTLKQLEDFARATHTAVGFFFLPEPPIEALPIPDLRTLPEARNRPPSVDLLETIYLCQQRQAWYRDYAQIQGESPIPIVGSATLRDPPGEVAAQMRVYLGFDIEARQAMGTWTEALRTFIHQTEEAGVLVMTSGIVGNNTHRPLDVTEFRGFALADDLAPLVFINGKDSKAAQMFTLAHELAHLWLGDSGVSDSDVRYQPSLRAERWCNEVAAELLVPLDMVKDVVLDGEALSEALQRLARRFKVSTLVILRRLFDARRIDRKTLEAAWQEETERLDRIARPAGGGDFYNTLGARVGRRFIRAVISSALEGQTPFTEAFRLLGIRKSATFYEEAERLGFVG